MFEPQDFTLPLECDLKLRVINDEIEDCTDPKILQDHLKQVTKLVMVYQNMLSQIVKRQLTQDIEEFEKEFLAMKLKDNS